MARRNRKCELCERENSVRERRYSLFSWWEHTTRTMRTWEQDEGASAFSFSSWELENENVGTDWGSVGTLCCYHQVASSREQRTRTLRAWEQAKGALSLLPPSNTKGERREKEAMSSPVWGLLCLGSRYKRIAADEIVIIHTQVTTGSIFFSFFLFFPLLFW